LVDNQGVVSVEGSLEDFDEFFFLTEGELEVDVS
jgi:hypothetical protein